MTREGRIFVGTSGWHYESWVRRFYPEGMPAARMLAYYARRFPAVEVNSTFYGLPEHATVEAWREATPRGFRFACKASRYLTHMKKLTDRGPGVARFLSALEPLGGKLGPLLFELPPNWAVAPQRLEAFLAALPPLRAAYAFEFRNRTWFTAPVYKILRRYDAALCLYDLEAWRSPVEVTSHLVYLRLHGPGRTAYTGSYDGRTLSGWARRALAWSEEGREVHVYFNNDVEANAPRDAGRLLQMVERLQEEAKVPSLRRL